MSPSISLPPHDAPLSGGSPFPPIADYGFLSDCHTGALVAPDGSTTNLRHALTTHYDLGKPSPALLELCMVVPAATAGANSAAAAKEAGFDDIPAPPTYAFSGMTFWGTFPEIQPDDTPEVNVMADVMGPLIAKGGIILHGEQSFDCLAGRLFARNLVRHIGRLQSRSE